MNGAASLWRFPSRLKSSVVKSTPSQYNMPVYKRLCKGWNINVYVYIIVWIIVNLIQGFYLDLGFFSLQSEVSALMVIVNGKQCLKQGIKLR